MKSAYTVRPLWALVGMALLATPSLILADEGKNCTLIIPPNPFTAAGLATPYRLQVTPPDATPCDEINKDHSAFVQAAIIDRVTGKVSIYNPLVITDGATPAKAPVVPTLPASAVVALWFGFNGGTLSLVPPSGASIDCHQGFGQFAYCNAPAFFTEAHNAILAGKLAVPALGNGSDGQLCPSVRSFAVVDQDQSDNLPTTYLITSTNKMAQNTAANAALFPTATVRSNGSDNRLTDEILDKALGCTPWKAPDLANPGFTLPALPLNELQAGQFQTAPVAMVPLGDPFTPDLGKVNEYRRGVDQPVATAEDASTKTYCQNLRTIAPAKLTADKPILTCASAACASPDPAKATNLFTFMALRLFETYNNLGCQPLLALPNPVIPKFEVVSDAILF
ncbi:MAG: hypothetical protein M3Z09_13155 [Acidobacteriota bacterium]|nr:hypothetical protein [Acidobacteriota bacterium]